VWLFYLVCLCKHWLLRCLVVIDFPLCVICFLTMFPDVVCMSLHIPGSMCVGVTLWFGWGRERERERESARVCVCA